MKRRAARTRRPAPGIDEASILKQGGDMNTDTWVVRTLGGEEWGFIKRLIIDPITRQIKEADIILAETGKVVRIPWDNLDLQSEGIRLSVSQGEVHPSPPEPAQAGMAQSVAMDLWP
jgi:hypothetical protein